MSNVKMPHNAGKEEYDFIMSMQRVYPKDGGKRNLADVILHVKETISKDVQNMLKLNKGAEPRPAVVEANKVITFCQGLMLNYAVATHLQSACYQPGGKVKGRQKALERLAQLVGGAQQMPVNPLAEYLQSAVSEVQAGKELLPLEPLVTHPAAEDSEAKGRPAGKAKAAPGKAGGKLAARAGGKKRAQP